MLPATASGAYLPDKVLSHVRDFLDFLSELLHPSFLLGAVREERFHQFAVFDQLLALSHQPVIGFEEHFLDGIFGQVRALALFLRLAELSIALPDHAAVHVV